MRFLSACSGIEAASVAWLPLGWECVGLSEIEPFPCAVLNHHYPKVPNHGDLTRQESWKLPAFDVLCGGTPCQGFSVAGKRGGLADARSQLVWHFLEIARRERPRWVLWENVPGVLSSDGGRDFGAVLGRLGECGYGFAYRILDAQYFGVAQRRRRVFVVGYLGDWRPAAAVLFERESMSGNPAPRREAGEGAAPTISARTKGGGGLGTDFDLDSGLVEGLSNRGTGTGTGTETLRSDCNGAIPMVAHPLKADGFDGSEDGTGRGVPLVAQPLRSGRQYSDMGDGQANVIPDVSPALKQRDHKGPSSDGDGDGAPLIPCGVAIRSNQGNGGNRAGIEMHEPLPVLTKQSAGADAIGFTNMAVRRLTPRECERLQGFPDDYTLIPYRGKPAADGPRYKALGNSWAVPCARWIGERIMLVQGLIDGTL